MKGLNKLGVALAMAGLPLASQGEVQPLDDAALGDVTGQAGVTIELQTKVDIGEFTYTDEGSVSIKDISIGGANRTDLFSDYFGSLNMTGPASEILDNIKINIDILADGDAVINFLPVTFAAVDFKITQSNWELLGNSGESTVLLENYTMEGALGGLTARLDTATDVLNLELAFAVENLEVDVPFLALGIRDMRILGADFDPVAPQPLELFVDAELDIFKGPNAFGDDSLAIDLAPLDMDVRIGGLLVGGTSIGSVVLDDLSLRNTQLRVYGHD